MSNKSSSPLLVASRSAGSSGPSRGWAVGATAGCDWDDVAKTGAGLAAGGAARRVTPVTRSNRLGERGLAGAGAFPPLVIAAAA